MDSWCTDTILQREEPEKWKKKYNSSLNNELQRYIYRTYEIHVSKQNLNKKQNKQTNIL